jgi:hypothetical protein
MRAAAGVTGCVLLLHFFACVLYLLPGVDTILPSFCTYPLTAATPCTAITTQTATSYLQVQPGEQPDEAYAVFQYTVYDMRTPLIDDQGNKSRKVQIEQSRFLQDPETKLWRFADYKLVEVPEVLARTAEMQAKDMAAAAAAGPAAVGAAEAEQQQ